VENGVTTITRTIDGININQVSTSQSPIVISANNPSVKVDEPGMFYGLTCIGILGLGMALQKRKITI
jgi:hypothetical protein